MQGTLKPSGALHARLIRGSTPAPLSWRLRNWLRLSFIQGLLGVLFARLISQLFPVLTITSELKAVLIRADGSRVNYGVLSRKVITDTGVGFIVDAWQNSVELENMKYHGVGTGGTAEAANQTALITESTTALNPDSTRATGTQGESAANIATSVGTVTFDGSAAITEHGLFSQAATGGGVMFDRSLFSAINVVSGDSIQFTYSLTLTSGG